MTTLHMSAFVETLSVKNVRRNIQPHCIVYIVIIKNKLYEKKVIMSLFLYLISKHNIQYIVSYIIYYINLQCHTLQRIVALAYSLSPHLYIF